jgi:hypothetical protein
MTSDRHGARDGRAATLGRQRSWGRSWWRSRVGGGVLVALACGGCFGEWVSARPRPRPRQGSEVEASPASDTGTPAPADPCAAYLAAVAERCDSVLGGDMGVSRCHIEIVRVMALYHEGDVPLDHRPRAPGGRERAEAGDRQDWPPAQACAQQLRALPEVEPRRRAGPELGPACRAWAQALRERCVVPLSAVPPDLRRCGPDLPAFESTLGAITFGRPQDYEPQCRDAVERLQGATTG